MRGRLALVVVTVAVVGVRNGCYDFAARA